MFWRHYLKCLLIKYSFTLFLSVLCIRFIKAYKNPLYITVKWAVVCFAFILVFLSWREQDEYCILQPATRGQSRCKVWTKTTRNKNI